MNWFRGPLSDVFGLPAFWVVRFATILQFLSGTVIVIEILGEKRVEDIADRVRHLLDRVAEARPLRELSNDLQNLSKHFALTVFYLLTFRKALAEEQRAKLTRAKYHRQVMGATLLISFVGSYWFVLTHVELFWFPGLKHWVNIALVSLQAIVLSFVAFCLLAYVVYLVAINLVVLIIYLVFRPLEWMFDLLARWIVRILGRRPLAQALFVASLLLLTVGIALELLAS